MIFVNAIGWRGLKQFRGKFTTIRIGMKIQNGKMPLGQEKNSLMKTKKPRICEALYVEAHGSASLRKFEPQML